MSEFTYNVPDEKKYFAAIIQFLNNSSAQKEKQIAEKLKNGYCNIDTSSLYSGKRWDSMSTTVYFYVSVDNLNFFDKEIKYILSSLCDKLMPKDAGYDVLDVEIVPILDEIPTEITLSSDLEYIQKSISNQSLQFLPDDVKDKGKEMAEIYIYLYCVENSLRLFMEKVFKNNLGNEYISKISVPNTVKTSIQARKSAEQKNQWISIRGNSELFYLDFKELATLMINNWDLFKNYFPDQQWLNVKIDELGNCRNLIAHNSYVSSLEKEVIRLNYNQIIKQITNVEKEILPF